VHALQASKTIYYAFFTIFKLCSTTEQMLLLFSLGLQSKQWIIAQEQEIVGMGIPKEQIYTFVVFVS
jgi:hypothetical protein